MGTLTVRENLHFSASLRLPGGLSKQEREERVEATLSDLGLYHVAESKVCSCTTEKPWRRGGGRGGRAQGFLLTAPDEFSTALFRHTVPWN